MSNRQVTRRELLGGLAGMTTILAGGGFLAACAPTTSSSPGATAGAAGTSVSTPGSATKSLRALKFLTPLRQSISWAPIYSAKEGGFFEREGFDVEIIGGTGTASAYQQMVSSQVNFARAGGMTGMIARANEGIPVKTVYQIYQEIQFFLLSLPGKPIKSPADFRGRTIGVASRGGDTENLVHLMAQTVGLGRNDYQVEAVGVGAGPYGLMEQGRIDGTLNTDAALVELRSLNKPMEVLSPDDFVTMPADSYVARDQQIAEEGDFVLSMLRALRQGHLLAIDDPAKAAEYVGKYSPDDVANKDLAIKKIENMRKLWIGQGSRNTVGSIDLAKYEAAQTLLRQGGFINQTIQPTEYADPQFVQRLLAS